MVIINIKLFAYVVCLDECDDRARHIERHSRCFENEKCLCNCSRLSIIIDFSTVFTICNLIS